MSPRIEPADARGLEDALPQAEKLLIDVVGCGASIGFLPPLSRSDAHAYWLSAASALRDGSRVLWLARGSADAVLGAVQLDLCMRANGLHRAEVVKLMVAPSERRAGIGRGLMQAAEAGARALGRTTLVLDTREGDPSEALYQSLGWQRAGSIPQYARSSDGHLHATTFYYKLLGPVDRVA